MLKEGDRAPDFTLMDQDGREVRLSDFAGKPVVVYFYSRDNTSGCTRQALAFRDAHERLKELGAVLLGISRDSEASHRRFADKNALPFPLLSDPELTVLQAFGVWQEKELYGKTSMGVVRSVFVIGGDGRVLKVFKRVKPDTGTAEALAYLEGINGQKPE
jgi:peroxiredoxin Q/BCP